MKIRLGFVSNSSSSSFVCEVCGDSFKSYNEGPAHFGLMMCEGHDHLFCEMHRINPKKENNHDVYAMIEHEEDDDRIDSIHCPICQLKVITKDMVLDYALHKLGMKYNNIACEIKNVYKTYDELYDENCMMRSSMDKFDVGYITREDLVYAHPLHQRYESDIRNFVDKLDDATLKRIADKMTEELFNNGAISEALAMVVNEIDIFEEYNSRR